MALAYAEIKKVHAKTGGILKPQVQQSFGPKGLAAGAELELPFSLTLPENCPITDKKSSYFLTYGRELSESHLMLKIEPKALFSKVIGLLDTFHRFKLKDMKGTKHGVEYKLIPPSSREMASLENMNLAMQMQGEQLALSFEFQGKKLDTSAVTTKVNKETVKIKRELSPKDYSLGRDMLNQDQLLKVLEEVLNEVKMKNVF